jgi:type I restriction enzyme S subunit
MQLTAGDQTMTYLMALCDQLEASLATTATTRSKLLNALLHEALEPTGQAMEAAE